MDSWLSKNLINLLPMTFRILFLKRWHIKFFVTLVKISDGGLFSITANECTDCSNKSQSTLDGWILSFSTRSHRIHWYV